MGIFGSVLGAIALSAGAKKATKAVGSALGLKGKKAAAVAPLPMVTRDDAARMIADEDELRRRKGGAADILTGTSGAEAALSGGKLILGN